jgi:hypothetical protein
VAELAPVLVERDKAEVDRVLKEKRLAAQQATAAFGDLVRVRADWVADRIIMFRSTADKIEEFASAELASRPSGCTTFATLRRVFWLSRVSLRGW